jgi:uncharacterized protein YpuA (DUF1002 family)
MLIVLLVLMERTMQDETKQVSEIELAMLDQDVIELHNIARRIEKNIGQGQLSDDLRHVADRLNALLKRY